MEKQNKSEKFEIVTTGSIWDGTGDLIWDKKNYVDTTDVFQNFSGGRRVYLPVIGSWKEE